jgi:hypothetical protein
VSLHASVYRWTSQTLDCALLNTSAFQDVIGNKTYNLRSAAHLVNHFSRTAFSDGACKHEELP